jgi:hypothetical protein
MKEPRKDIQVINTLKPFNDSQLSRNASEKLRPPMPLKAAAVKEKTLCIK